MFILLDIDGVMVSNASWKKIDNLEDGFSEFMPSSVSSLNRIVEETGSKIILITTHQKRFSNEEWTKIFYKRGINADVSTSNLDGSKLDIILNWAKLNNDIFVVIDDDKSLNDLPNYLKDRLVLTNGLVGLNDGLSEIVIKLLKNERY